MIDNSAAFKAEFKALMEKYNVQMDFIEHKSQVNFYTDFGRGRAVVLQFDLDSETIDSVADSIK